MKNYVLYDGIIDINKTSALVNSTKELFAFLNLKIPVLKNAPRDLGFESIGLDMQAFHLSNAKVLALGTKEEKEIICAEDSSFLSLRISKEELAKNDKLRENIETQLAKEGLELDLKVKVHTLAQFLLKNVGLAKLKKRVENKFDNFRTALYLGSYKCQIQKYSDINAYETLLKMIGLSLVDYKLKDQVNGYEIIDVQEELSFKMAGTLMLDIFDNAADFVIINDARSFIMFDNYQKELEKSIGREIGLSIFGLAEILLLAFGVINKSKIGLNLHKIKTDIV
ncbi:MAG: hypothetical protein L3J44_06280 [Campylobacteraceae bacterium]|nr:hypothetical protein [Campylobacteraceae bacterium]